MCKGRDGGEEKPGIGIQKKPEEGGNEGGTEAREERINNFSWSKKSRKEKKAHTYKFTVY